MTQADIALEQDAPIKGIAFLVFATAIFSVQDVIIKLLSPVYPAHEIVFFRSLVGMLPILLIVQYEGGLRQLRTRRPLLHLARGLLGFVAYTTYYLALTALPLADTVTIFYASPLFVTALAVPFLGEAVGFRRWIAVLLGFVGVIVITRPFGSDLEPAMFLAVITALSYAGSILITRKLAGTESGSCQAFYLMLTFLVASCFAGLLMGDGRFAVEGHPSAEFLLRAWTWPTREDALLMLLVGLISGTGFYCISQAYRIASASVAAPFEYCSLPWAILWGYVFWSDLPASTTLLGVILVVGSGLYIIHREGIRGRKLVRGRPLR